MRVSFFGFLPPINKVEKRERERFRAHRPPRLVCDGCKQAFISAKEQKKHSRRLERIHEARDAAESEANRRFHPVSYDNIYVQPYQFLVPYQRPNNATEGRPHHETNISPWYQLRSRLLQRCAPRGAGVVNHGIGRVLCAAAIAAIARGRSTGQQGASGRELFMLFMVLTLNPQKFHHHQHHHSSILVSRTSKNHSSTPCART